MPDRVRMDITPVVQLFKRLKGAPAEETKARTYYRIRPKGSLPARYVIRDRTGILYVADEPALLAALQECGYEHRGSRQNFIEEFLESLIGQPPFHAEDS
ncbi:MAG: hypothetical protein ACRD4B_02480 [Acidobacteriota bacterium]